VAGGLPVDERSAVLSFHFPFLAFQNVPGGLGFGLKTASGTIGGFTAKWITLVSFRAM
jgi:hypothetical protein